MAKPKDTTTKPKTSIFLCCFGSSHAKESTTKGSDAIISKKKKKTSWFSGPSIRIRLIHKKSASKTVPLEASSISDHVHYSKSRSKSTLHHNSQAPPVLPATPYYTPTQTRHGPHGVNKNVEDTRQQGRGSPGHAKRQARRLSSSVQSQTTPRKPQNAESSYDPVVGMSVLAVTLLIMIFWGRLCAILCTSAWLYCTPHFRKSPIQNDHVVSHVTKLNDVVDLDSDEYKKKVIMEGLLGRNHRDTL